MAFCTKCGKQLDDTAKFCPGCGTPLEQPTATQQTNNTTEEKPQPQQAQANPFNHETPNPQQQANPVNQSNPNPQQQANPFNQGQPNPQQQANPFNQGQPNPQQQTNPNVNIPGDHTNEFDPVDVGANKSKTILAYLGILVLIPIFAWKDSKYVRFHANQGLVLLICEVIFGIFSGIVKGIIGAIIGANYYFSPYALANNFVYGTVSGVLNLISVAFLVFVIIGIVNAAQGKAKELPLIGKIKILK